ncbi:hypothetical protein Tco_1237029 [Tanacetum coccineum]
MITDQEVDEDEDISEEAKTEFLVEIQGKKWVPTIAAFHKIKSAYNDILKSQCETGAEYEYHIHQMTNYMNNQIMWECTQEDVTPQVPEKQAQVFQGCERDPKAPMRYLCNKDLFFLKYGNTKVDTAMYLAGYAVLDKEQVQELTGSLAPTSEVPPPSPSSKQSRQVQGEIARMSRQYEVIPKIVTKTTDGIMKGNLPWLVVDVVKKERERTKSDVPDLVSQEFVVHAPQIIKELFRVDMDNTVLNVHSSSTSFNFDMQYQMYLKMKNDPESQAVDSII